MDQRNVVVTWPRDRMQFVMVEDFLRVIRVAREREKACSSDRSPKGELGRVR